MKAKRPDDFVVEVVSAKRLEEPKVEVVQLTETKSYIIPEGYKTPVKELESKLLKTKDHSWSGIDKLMRDICNRRKLGVKQLHDDFKAENDGLTPDEWIAGRSSE